MMIRVIGVEKVYQRAADSLNSLLGVLMTFFLQSIKEATPGKCRHWDMRLAEAAPTSLEHRLSVKRTLMLLPQRPKALRFE